MDIVRDFIKEQFNDDDEFYEQKDNSGREVRNLKKELDELKFYQELERTDYEDMKRKMYNNDKKKKGPAQRKMVSQPVLGLTQDTGDSNDIFDSISEDNNVNDKLKKKDEEIARLEKKLKNETAPKEFGKRMHKLEKSKNEEIEEIKKHYKGLMEQLAKQIQKSNERYDDEVKKNSKIRDTMEEMRQDMASREQELEDRLLEMEAVLKKSEHKAYKLEQKLEMAEENLANKQVKLSTAHGDHEELEMKMRDLEEDFEDERREMIKVQEKEKDALEAEANRKMVDLKDDVQELQEKLQDVLEKLDIEERAHEDTVVQLRDTDAALKAQEEDNEKLDQVAKEAVNEARLYRIQAETEVKGVREDRKQKLGDAHERINKLTSDNMTLTLDLKTTTGKLFAAEKKVDLMGDNTAQKQGALRRKNEELEQLQEILRNLCDKNVKDVKSRDLQFVKERKKYQTAEQVLRRELEEIKVSPAYQRLLNVSAPRASSTASEAELRENVEQLRAEKASLLLQMSAVKDRSSRDLKQLEKRLKNAESAAPAYPHFKKEEPIYAHMKRSISFSSSVASTESAVASKTSAFKPIKPMYQSTGTSKKSINSVATNAEVSVGGDSKAEPAKQSLSSTAYRRQVRHRKFANKALE